jgi:hypothetical protein
VGEAGSRPTACGAQATAGSARGDESERPGAVAFNRWKQPPVFLDEEFRAPGHAEDLCFGDGVVRLGRHNVVPVYGMMVLATGA